MLTIAYCFVVGLGLGLGVGIKFWCVVGKLLCTPIYATLGCNCRTAGSEPRPGQSKARTNQIWIWIGSIDRVDRIMIFRKLCIFRKIGSSDYDPLFFLL